MKLGKQVQLEALTAHNERAQRAGLHAAIKQLYAGDPAAIAARFLVAAVRNSLRFL